MALGGLYDLIDTIDSIVRNTIANVLQSASTFFERIEIATFDNKFLENHSFVSHSKTVREYICFQFHPFMYPSFLFTSLLSLRNAYNVLMNDELCENRKVCEQKKPISP